jgi:hypothetical protein
MVRACSPKVERGTSLGMIASTFPLWKFAHDSQFSVIKTKPAFTHSLLTNYSPIATKSY